MSNSTKKGIPVPVLIVGAVLALSILLGGTTFVTTMFLYFASCLGGK